jgi:hypothetical protein
MQSSVISIDCNINKKSTGMICFILNSRIERIPKSSMDYVFVLNLLAETDNK